MRAEGLVLPPPVNTRIVMVGAHLDSVLPQPLKAAGSELPATIKTYTGPVSNDAASAEFTQVVNATDALRTGTYSKTLTFTLSTTTP